MRHSNLKKLLGASSVALVLSITAGALACDLSKALNDARAAAVHLKRAEVDEAAARRERHAAHALKLAARRDWNVAIMEEHRAYEERAKANKDAAQAAADR